METPETPLPISDIASPKRRRYRRVFGGVAMVLLGPPLLYGFLAVVLTWIPTNRDFVPDPNGVTIYVQTNGVHTDICVPTKNDVYDFTTIIPAGYFYGGTKPYVSFGWGDLDFYLNTPNWEDLTVGTAVSAVFFPSPTAMHVRFYYTEEAATYDAVPIDISREQYQLLVEFIRDSFRRDETGSVVLIDHPGYEPGFDRFFDANGSYHLINTCNNWTNKALKQAGVKTATWAPFEWSVFYHLPRRPP